jgi:hypothetical protein
MDEDIRAIAMKKPPRDESGRFRAWEIADRSNVSMQELKGAVIEKILGDIRDHRDPDDTQEWIRKTTDKKTRKALIAIIGPRGSPHRTVIEALEQPESDNFFKWHWWWAVPVGLVALLASLAMWGSWLLVGLMLVWFVLKILFGVVFMMGF